MKFFSVKNRATLCCVLKPIVSSALRRSRLAIVASMLFTLLGTCGIASFAQTNLTAPVTLNQKAAFDSTTFAVPTAGTYLVAAGGRLRGEYIVTIERPYDNQTVHLIVSGSQYDPGPTIQILDNHSYQMNTMLSNFRVMIPSGDAVTAYLLMDVGNLSTYTNTTVTVQYQGSAGYPSGLGSAGGAIPTGLTQVGTTVIGVNEWNVGIGTANPAARLEVNGGIRITPSSNGSISFADGTSQSTAWTGSANNIALGANANVGRLTIANTAPDGQGSASQGIVFTDSLNGPGSSQWTHAAIYTVGETGFNGDLVFATDGDGQNDNKPTEKMRILYDGRVGIGTATPAQKLEVNGNIQLTANSGAHINFPDGSQQSVAWTGTLSGGDYAESVDIAHDRAALTPGDLIVIDPDHDGQFVKSTGAYSTLVSGVYATKPGVTGRRQQKSKPSDSEVPMAMVGIVPTKVSSENGPIHRGDLLVSSATAGYAMKGTDRGKLTGTVIGKALGELSTGTGVIEVLISLQ